MRRAKSAVFGLGFVLLAGTGVANAGCIGPVIMGECEGQDVPWDTRLPSEQHPAPPAGSRWDWRGTQEQRQPPNEINPFTGHDPQDSHWLNQGTTHDSAAQAPQHLWRDEEDERDDEEDE
jgi:hypothetical protein